MNSNGLRIQPATPGDYERLLPRFLDLRRFSRERHPPQSDDFDAILAASRDYLREILDRGPESRTFLALIGDAIAGYLIAVIHEPNPLTTSGAARSGAIDELYIDDACRGAGAGHLLIQAAEAWLRERGIVRITVGAYAWNAEALGFYEREGFRPWTATLMKELSDGR